MVRKLITDQRIIEACAGVGIDIDTASPDQMVEAYAHWVLGSPYWATVFEDIMRNAGVKL
jgi:hypothetical protein